VSDAVTTADQLAFTVVRDRGHPLSILQLRVEKVLQAHLSLLLLLVS
jgi:hypothetical protein